MEEKRFIKCNGVAIYAKVIEKSFTCKKVHRRIVEYKQSDVMVDIGSIKEMIYVANDTKITTNVAYEHEYTVPKGWYIASKFFDFRVADEEVEGLLQSKRRSTNVAEAVNHLTTELSYHPGLAFQGSEYLKAADRQRDHFSDEKK